MVDAVRCAIEVQSGLIERNAGLPPERRIEFRVGIHLGDVVEESDGDLMGDGVNIAARLEGVAEPGAICLSEDAYRQVKGRLDLAVTDLGPTQLKNIAEPIRVYSLEVGKPAQAKPATEKAFFAPRRSRSGSPRWSYWSRPALVFLGANRTATVATSRQRRRVERRAGRGRASLHRRAALRKSLRRSRTRTISPTASPRISPRICRASATAS